MGLFRFKRRNKVKKKQLVASELQAYNAAGAEETRSSADNNNNGLNKIDNVTIEQVPELVKELRNSMTQDKDDSSASPRILRQLFGLSEHGASLEETRQAMVADGTLVPTLLDFLRQKPEQHAQLYLCLLLLNNLSIPMANKRTIAVVHEGATVLSELLVKDPSIHLIVIVLVNLTFCNSTLRQELMATTPILDALSYAFLCSRMTSDEYKARQHALEKCKTLKERLETADDLETYRTRSKDQWSYPDTARWCLVSIQNLTRPSKQATAVQLKIVPPILSCIAVAPMPDTNLVDTANKDVENSFSSTSTNETPIPAEPTTNQSSSTPSAWTSQSVEDTALFVILHLAVTAREFLMKKTEAVTLLSNIATHGVGDDKKGDHAQIAKFQSLKARLALAHLVGCRGHYGQARSSLRYADADKSVLYMTKTEVDQLIELLANTLNRRSKEGPGGYSSATFGLKYVLAAVRFLLTQPENQIKFVKANVELLNALLMKVLGLHSLQQVTYIDRESAEHACFSLYLLSNYGFHACFLPTSLGRDYSARSIVAKVLTTLRERADSTPATRHAASQILLRVKYLIFNDETNLPRHLFEDDYCFDVDLVKAAKQVVMAAKVHSGAQPRADIFNRPVLRDADKNKDMDPFPSALYAVQELSFGSRRVRHVNAIDDILIANNIANNADGNKSESYGYVWFWDDDMKPRSKEEARSMSPLMSLAIGFPSLCGCDTTTK